MLMYPKEYHEFSQLIKKYVVLHVMQKVLDYDRNVMLQSTCKLASSYEELLREIEWNINQDLRSAKIKMKELGGMVIEQQQQQSVRIVKAKFRGFIYTHRFLNYVLQSEIEHLFKMYVLSLPLTTNKINEKT